MCQVFSWIMKNYYSLDRKTFEIVHNNGQYIGNILCDWLRPAFGLDEVVLNQL